MVSDERLSEIEALANAATSGPWERDYGGTIGHVKTVSPHYGGRTPTVATYDVWHRFNIAEHESESMRHPLSQQISDGEFIAESREIVPELVDEVRRLKDEYPAWHDRPTGPGLWVCDDGESVDWDAADIERHTRNGWDLGRVYGPIPEDSMETK